MFTKCIVAVAIVAFCGMLVSSNHYGPVYNDMPNAYEPQPQYHQQPQTYSAPAYSAPTYQAPAYHAPAYPKAPSSAHHYQYDNYIPKQTYQAPSYAPPKPMYQPMPYQAKPAYPSSHMDEYKK